MEGHRLHHLFHRPIPVHASVGAGGVKPLSGSGAVGNGAVGNDTNQLSAFLALVPAVDEGESLATALARVQRCVDGWRCDADGGVGSGGGGGGGGAVGVGAGAGAKASCDGSDGDLVVLEEFVTLSLRCPVRGSRMQEAGRFKECSHMGCFDLRTIVEMFHTSGKWQCPVCMQLSCFNSLIIDPFFHRICHQMSHYSTDITDIHLRADGTWRPKLPPTHIPSKSPKSVRCSKSPKSLRLLRPSALCAMPPWRDVRVPLTDAINDAASEVQQGGKRKSVEESVVQGAVLVDDEDEEAAAPVEAPPVEPVASRTRSGAGGARARGEGKKSRGRGRGRGRRGGAGRKGVGSGGGGESGVVEPGKVQGGEVQAGEVEIVEIELEGRGKASNPIDLSDCEGEAGAGWMEKGGVGNPIALSDSEG